MTSKKEQRRRDLARRMELQALEAQLEDSVPPPERFGCPSQTRDPRPTGPFEQSHSGSVPISHPFHAPSTLSQQTLTSNLIRLDSRIATLDQNISDLVAMSGTGSLVFAHDPRNQEMYRRRRHETMSEANIGPHALSLKPRVNQHFLLVESKLCSISREISSLLSERTILARQQIICEGMVERAENALIVLDTQKEAEWHRQRPGPTGSKQRVINSGLFVSFSDD